MALQVWLPFTKDWTNQGLDNSATLSSANATIVDGGKLGKCLQITGIGTSATFNNLKNITQFSVSVWVRNDATSEYGNWADIIQMQVNHTNGYMNRTENSTFRIERSNASNPNAFDGYFDFYQSGTNASTGAAVNTSITKSTSIPINTWKHITLTFDGEVGKWYFNGTHSASQKFSDRLITNYKLTGKVTIGAGGNPKSSINDLRIYDHCLSPEEIKQLSQGLILHYPMNQNLSNQYNLPTITKDNATWGCVLFHNTPETQIFANRTAAAHSGTFESGLYSRLDLLTSNNFKNSQGAIEFMALQKTTSSASEVIYRWTQSNSPCDTTAVTNYTNISNTLRGLCLCNGRTYLAHTETISNWQGACGAYDKHQGGIPGISNNVVTSGYLKLYVRLDTLPLPTVKDASGFGNDAIAHGEIIAQENSPKYDYSSRIMNSDTSAESYIYRDYFDLKQFTFSCWFNQSSRTTVSNDTTTSIQFIISQGRDYNNYCFNLSINNGFPVIYCGEGTKDTSGNSVTPGYSIQHNKAVSLNTWHHLVGTYDGTQVKLYVDGNLSKSQSVSNIPWTDCNNKLVIGKMAYCYTYTNRYRGFVGSISDVRIYATALSDEDVKDLYNQKIIQV